MSDTHESSGGLATRSIFGDRPPLRPGQAAAAVARSVLKAAVLLTQRRIRQPTAHVGDVLGFADGTSASVYRETVVRRPKTRDPAVLVVAFRLRWVRGRWHAAFRAESLLNTPLFVGFEGLVSKLWLSHDELGRYRGLYEWDAPRWQTPTPGHCGGCCGSSASRAPSTTPSCPADTGTTC